MIDSYGYDKTGNRISLTIGAGASTYSYPTADHGLTNVGDIARAYDAAGSTTGINGMVDNRGRSAVWLASARIRLVLA
ncbi:MULTISPECIES: hypothetical protein [Pseudoxanthomonas]|uniref:Uncharacterized protein RhaS with RHS repeats n=1 Tax=Pseudoxanthomonas winnipegensis TaxID=2480810 RepID=A0AAW8GAA6_9GAMM|nr:MULTISPECIES: hypothetical protein [Pseudoxanthomonas]MDQ1117931.1 uncharacterized protein RhaS with RHS repeats [Pseudoxanthomonas winnipegensis]MDQ1134900.1 uncharacterized protein RhaS with RHS repeats [Pseudoxanthomonas winnipegensis]MDR6138867.1 uncharacterized protein RhaS with RHS repeats [Pseudoxanthomonas sp. SORGH_AS_0997]